MNMEKQSGIILKNYDPKRQKIAILDQFLGYIECSTIKVNQRISQWHHGSLIHYYLTQPYNRLGELELESRSLSLASYDILFFHHILELCRYSLPHGSPATDIFNLLKTILVFDYINLTINQWSDSKRFFLCKFFSNIGIYPDTCITQSNYFHYLISLSVESMFNVSIPDSMTQSLDTWLWCCLEMHPQRKQFKTMLEQKGDL